MIWKTLETLPPEGLVWMCRRSPYVPMLWDVSRYRAAMAKELWSAMDTAPLMTHWMEVPDAPAQ